ncbi:MAG: bifunctional methylenetetrahydrofolate dehydrogenase/methenyltetrahydrofolate cyclohydrolase FolD [Planctomycetota bacterium]|nr:bifunctional methylenetetrahydrofolate dehydrogenase/methenyltetrahydrofolate cyclohydrolase FolD [Planctomycetota bacterium]
MAVLLDGKSLSNTIRNEIQAEVADFSVRHDQQPQLAAILVGDDPASQVYVRNKERACAKTGMKSQLHRLDSSTSQDSLLALIDRLNQDPRVNGILVQLPLPGHIQEQVILDSIHPLKDVDAFHPENVGRVLQGRPRFVPCTPHGCLQLLVRNGISTAGKQVVVLGRSEIVGKPVANMLVQKDFLYGPEYANATVTLCHSRTRDLEEITRSADILIAAIGKPNFVTAGMVKTGVVAVDVGINRTDAGLVGDIDFESVEKKASHITPVPGGVGPMTITMLLKNTLTAAQLQLAGS